MRWGALLLALLLLPAMAPQPGVAPPPGAALPPDLLLEEAAAGPMRLGDALGGLPAVFAFADYACAALCGTALGLAAAGLPRAGLRPGQDYRLVVLGLDPGDGAAKAAAMRDAWLGEGTALADSARFLVGTASAVARAEAVLGYHAVRHGAQYLHPLVLFVLRADGRLAATLPALGAAPEELRDALRDAARAETPGLLARVKLLCQGVAAGGHGWLRTALSAMGAATITLLGGGLLLLWRREGRA